MIGRLKSGLSAMIWVVPACTFFIQSLHGQSDESIASTQYGRVQGSISDQGIHIFKGIPFAKPPVGDLRWKSPQAPDSWEGILEANQFGPSPMQAPPRPFLFWSSEFLIPEVPISEDCLYLNVWTPRVDEQAKLPVVVYIYGGGFRSGGSACPIYDGENTAREGVVYVSINYRVGLFGFLAHPELTKESPNKTSGNYGIQDMIAGLSWVRDNISKFGGDPNRVTIAGQSAGAFAVNYLTVSPLARNLFHGAIAESGADFRKVGLGRGQLLTAAQNEGITLQEEMGFSGISELRSLPASELLKATKGGTWPIVDGYTIPMSVSDMYTMGLQAKVPVLMGWNKEDILYVRPQSPEEFHSGLEQRFGSWADQFKAVYLAADSNITLESQKRLSRDETFGTQIYSWAKGHANSSGEKVFVYNFNRGLPAYTEESAFGAFHSGEIVYAYNNLHTLDRPWGDEDRALSSVMTAYWINFIKFGNPNGSGLPVWPEFSLDTQQVMLLDTVSEVSQFKDQKVYELWELFESERE